MDANPKRMKEVRLEFVLRDFSSFYLTLVFLFPLSPRGSGQKSVRRAWVSKLSTMTGRQASQSKQDDSDWDRVKFVALQSTCDISGWNIGEIDYNSTLCHWYTIVSTRHYFLIAFQAFSLSWCFSFNQRLFQTGFHSAFLPLFPIKNWHLLWLSTRAVSYLN